MKKILFVEDNAIAQTLIAEVFGGEYQIEIAGDYVTAMEKMNQGQFDLVVTDIFFPQETGTGKKELAGELAERLRLSSEKTFKDNWSPFNPGYERRRCTLEGIEGWVTSFKEDDQPLGVLIAEECESRNIPFRMASSLNHHSQMVQAVCDFARGHEWPSIFDYGTKGYAAVLEDNPKESKVFWEELKKEEGGD